MPGKKSAKFDKKGIESLAKDKPVVYRIVNKNEQTVYAGVAKKGRVEARLKEHLPGTRDAIRGGTRVIISQKPSIAEAKISEKRVIKRLKPPQNKIGK